MPNQSDSRVIPGNTVFCRASLVMSVGECKRLFGSVWKANMLSGTVTDVIVAEINGRRQKSVTVDWLIQSRTKRVTLKVVNINRGDVSSAVEVPSNPVGTSRESENAPEGLDSTEDSVSPVTPTEPEVAEIEGDDVVHDRTWKFGEVSYPLNGLVPTKTWKVIGQVGDVLTYGNEPRDYSPYDFFMYTLPLMHLATIVRPTNDSIDDTMYRPVTPGEILKLFGVLDTMTEYKATNRRDLWRTEPLTKYGPVANFGRFMSRARFDTILSNIRFSTLAEKSDVLESQSRWPVASGLVDAINTHRAKYVTPSDNICVDESISRWYGLGGNRIDVGLPHYVALDRKPENGCKIRTAACGKSGTMLRLKIVTGSVGSALRAFEDELSPSAAATLRLFSPWLRSDRIVCGDSWFASVSTAQALMRYRMRFIGVVKGATRQHPMKLLSEKELHTRGDHLSMVSKLPGDSMKLMALLWTDRQRRYFISSCSVTSPEEVIERSRRRKESDVTKKVEYRVDIPQVAEDCYKTCGQTDRHNRYRQDSLDLKKVFEAKSWALKVNTTLLSVCVVDAWLVYKNSMGPRITMCQAVFYEKLAEGLIDNTYNGAGVRGTDVDVPRDERVQEGLSGVSLHLTPTNRKRKRADGSLTKAVYQGQCRVCKSMKKSKFVCSRCRNERNDIVFLCHSDTGRHCFIIHIQDFHDVVKA